ncbi:MAG: LysR family transcriptional regulator [Peptococcaceae bacterium]|nr:LysR family transcriptional regulator [Peptococcaceae bacterium]
MKIEHMRYLIDLAKTESFTKTAQNFFITQSTLSYTIQQMEKEVGRKLFERTAWHGVRLTPFGGEFLELCNSTVIAYDTLVYRNDEAEFLELPEVIRMASCSALTSRILKELKPYMEESFPDIQLIVDEVDREEIFEKVQNEYDFGLISVKKEALDTKSAIYGYEVFPTILLDDHYVWCCNRKLYEKEMNVAVDSEGNSVELFLKNMSSFAITRDDYFQNAKLLDALRVLMNDGGALVMMPQYVYWMLFDKAEYQIIYRKAESVFCHALLRRRKLHHPVYRMLEDKIIEIVSNIKEKFAT